MPWPWGKRARRVPQPQAPSYQVSTVGDPATPTEHDLLDALPCVQQRLLPDDPERLTTTAFQLGTRLVEDLQIIQATRRWTPGAPDPLQFALPATTPQHQGAVRGRLSGQLLGQPGLANTRLDSRLS
jgi:hypothetical protein